MITFPEEVSFIGGEKLDPELNINRVIVNGRGDLVLQHDTQDQQEIRVLSYKIESGNISELKMTGSYSIKLQASKSNFVPRLYLLNSKFFVHTSKRTLVSYSLDDMNSKESKKIELPGDVSIVGRVFTRNKAILSFPEPNSSNRVVFSILDLDDSQSANQRLLNPYSCAY